MMMMMMMMRGSIPGLWDRDLSQRQMLNQLSQPGVSFGVLRLLALLDDVGLLF